MRGRGAHEAPTQPDSWDSSASKAIVLHPVVWDTGIPQQRLRLGKGSGRFLSRCMRGGACGSTELPSFNPHSVGGRGGSLPTSDQ